MNKLNKKRRQFIFISLLIPVTLLIAFVVFPAIDLFRIEFHGLGSDFQQIIILLILRTIFPCSTIKTSGCPYGTMPYIL